MAHLNKTNVNTVPKIESTYCIKEEQRGINKQVCTWELDILKLAGYLAHGKVQTVMLFLNKFEWTLSLLAKLYLVAVKTV